MGNDSSLYLFDLIAEMGKVIYSAWVYMFFKKLKYYIHWKIIYHQSVTMFKFTLSKFRALRMPKIILMRKALSSSVTKATEELRWLKRKISRRLRKKDTQLKINMKNTKNPWNSLKKEDIWKIESKFWPIRNQRMENSEVNPVQKKQTPWKSRN